MLRKLYEDSFSLGHCRLAISNYHLYLENYHREGKHEVFQEWHVVANAISRKWTTCFRSFKIQPLYQVTIFAHWFQCLPQFNVTIRRKTVLLTKFIMKVTQKNIQETIQNHKDKIKNKIIMKTRGKKHFPYWRGTKSTVSFHDNVKSYWYQVELMQFWTPKRWNWDLLLNPASLKKGKTVFICGNFYIYVTCLFTVAAPKQMPLPEVPLTSSTPTLPFTNIVKQ